MDKFEKTFEDLDVHTSVMEGAMAGATATTTPASQVCCDQLNNFMMMRMLRKTQVFLVSCLFIWLRRSGY